jgi:hypothetical protein
MRKEPDRDMENPYATRITKRFKEAEATAFWDTTPCNTIEIIIIIIIVIIIFISLQLGCHPVAVVFNTYTGNVQSFCF